MATPNPTAPNITPQVQTGLNTNFFETNRDAFNAAEDAYYASLAAHPDLQAALDNYQTNPDTYNQLAAKYNTPSTASPTTLPTSSDWKALLSDPTVRALGGSSPKGMTNFLQTVYGLPGDYYVDQDGSIQRQNWAQRNANLLSFGAFAGSGMLQGLLNGMSAATQGLGGVEAGMQSGLGDLTGLGFNTLEDAAGPTLAGLAAGPGAISLPSVGASTMGLADDLAGVFSSPDLSSLVDPAAFADTGGSALSEFGPYASGYAGLGADTPGLPMSLSDLARIGAPSGTNPGSFLQKLLAFSKQQGDGRGISTSDIAKLFGTYSQSDATNRSVAAGLTQNSDRLGLQAQDSFDALRQRALEDHFNQQIKAAEDQRLAETDAWQKLAAARYVLNGGQHNFPQVSPYQGPGPAAPDDIMKQAASTLQGQLLARLAPGGNVAAPDTFQPTPMFKPTPVSQFTTPSTGARVADAASLGLGLANAVPGIASGIKTIASLF